MSVLTAKVPIVLVSSVICLGVGAIGGAAGMAWLDSQNKPGQIEAKDGAAEGQDPAKKGGPPMGGMGGMGGKGMGGPPMGGMGMGGMGGGKGKGKGPSPKDQLAGLVKKLALLTDQPLKLELTKEERAVLASQLDGLQGMKDLSDAEAETRLNKALEVLKDHSDVLKAVGFRFPNEKFAPPAETANPFAEEPNRKLLEALQKKLGPPVG